MLLCCITVVYCMASHMCMALQLSKAGALESAMGHDPQHQSMHSTGSAHTEVALQEVLWDCREGCTAIVEVQQASTDTCSFFNQAYVLSGGEVVYHGGSSDQAMAVLGGSGMPCPPLYHPIEQYMRLIDPSFEVGKFC